MTKEEINKWNEEIKKEIREHPNQSLSRIEYFEDGRIKSFELKEKREDFVWDY